MEFDHDSLFRWLADLKIIFNVYTWLNNHPLKNCPMFLKNMFVYALKKL